MASTELVLEVLARDKASRTLRDIGDTTDRTGKSFHRTGELGRKMGVAVAAGLAVATAAAAKFASASIKEAVSLEQTLSKANVVFGEGAAEMEAWAATASKSFGLSKSQALAAAAQFGDFARQLGGTQQEASATSRHIVQLAGDLASFHNVDPSDVLDRIASSLRGEYDSLQKLIPAITDARVKQEALAATGKTSADALTAQEKAMAAIAIITKDSTAAHGDFNRTADQLANQQLIMKAQWADIQAEVGQRLLPVLSDLSGWIINDGIPALEAFGGWIGSNKREIVDFGATAGQVVLGLSEGIIRMSAISAEVLVGMTNSYRHFMNFFVMWADGILTYAAKAFGWLPVIGDDIKRAKSEFDAMQGVANARLSMVQEGLRQSAARAREAANEVGGIRQNLENLKDRTVYVNVRQRVAGETGFGGAMERAGGGPVTRGRAYLVGEREPELFVPTVSGRIYNQRQMAEAGLTGSPNVNVQVILAGREVIADEVRVQMDDVASTASTGTWV